MSESTRVAIPTTLTLTRIRWVASFLLVLFVGLKLTGQIDWPWLWVLSPFWIPLVGAVVIIVDSVIASTKATR